MSTTISVAARGGFGNSRGQGGDVVVLQTTEGSLGAATDNGNGTYTATLTSSTVAGEATIGGTINGEVIPGSALVQFVAGEPAVLVKFSGDGQQGVAGSQLDQDLVVRVEDAHGNPLPGLTVYWQAIAGGGW